ncbi:MAG: zinc ribbon domain-containing protein [Clostridia bacterium]|nr:zinc ribbon domain-containing protein [Clostridia bacterium]
MKRNIFKYALPIGIAGTIICIILFATNWHYELIVPIIENSSLEGAAFKFWDDFIFYSPLPLMALFLAYAIYGSYYNRRIAEKNLEAEVVINHEKNIKTITELKNKRDWIKRNFYNNCPKCGAPSQERETHCVYCGIDLEIKKE